MGGYSGGGGGGGRIAVISPNPVQGVAPNSGSNASGSGGGTPTVAIQQVAACTPTITSIQVNGQATNTIIAGTSGSISIYGSCLGSATSVQSDGSGLDFTSITYTADGRVDVSFQASNSPTLGAHNVTVTTVNGTSATSGGAQVIITSGPPTISGNQGIWWFGGVIPECDPAAGYPCYFTSTQLTVTAGVGGPTPSASAPAIWQPIANGDKVIWNCTDPSCASIMVTARAATAPDCYNSANQTQFTVSLGGVSSLPYYLAIDTPAGMVVVTEAYSGKPFIVDMPYTANSVVGYQTSIRYLIRSACGNVLSPIRTNEYFTQNTRSTAVFNGSVNNWPFVLNNPPPGSVYTGFWDVNDFSFDSASSTYFFIDNLTQTDTQPGTLNPAPLFPPANLNGLGGYLGTSSVWLIWQLQTFRVGSITQGLGYMVQLGDLAFYLDHARVLQSPPQ